MKELIEKMREANPYSGFTEQQLKVVNHIIDICAEIAASHYENKWVSVSDEGTPFPRTLASRIGSISEDVIFMADGLPRLGFYDYIGKTWQAQGFKTFKGADVTIWHPLPDLPTPPNSDKNVEDKTK